MMKRPPAPSREQFERGRWDVAWFAWVYLGIRLHGGQKRMAEAYLKRTESRWRAFYLWLMIAAGNRAGKTLGLAVIILHSCVYRMGLKPPEDPNDPEEVRRWATIPYHWWHFAVEQAPAEQVFVEIATLLAGIHPAQKFGCPWADAVGGPTNIATLSDTGLGLSSTQGSKERGEYAWIKLKPELGGAEVHFRSTKAKALSSIGQNMHGVSFDEAGLESNLKFLMNDILHARRLGTGGQFILIGTASVAISTDFADLWFTGDEEDPTFKPRRIGLRMSSRENVGFGLDEESFRDLIEGMDEDWISQNIDGEFIQSKQAWFNARSIDAAFRSELPVSQEPRVLQVYLQALDPGLKDICWSLVFRVRPDRSAVGVSIERQQGKQTTRGIVALGRRQHRAYAMTPDKPGEADLAFCMTGVDTTALGGHMFAELLEESIPSVTYVEFGGVTMTKRKLLSDLRTALDEGRLDIPGDGDWAELKRQLKNYKLLDRKIDQDLVMALAIIVKLLRMAPLSANEPPVAFEYGKPEAEPTTPGDNINPRTIRRLMRERRERAALTARAAGE